MDLQELEKRKQILREMKLQRGMQRATALLVGGEPGDDFGDTLTKTFDDFARRMI